MLMRFSRARVRPSRWARTGVLFGSLLIGAPAALRAQIGHRPSESPFDDVKLGQTLTASLGWMYMDKDPAGVAPQSAAFGQFRYDAAVGGPASLFARWSIIPSTRNLLAPLSSVTGRVTDKPSVVMHVLDGGVDLSLTGNKTWHHIVPSVLGGVGLVTDFASADSGGYQFGNKFSFSFGFAVRYMHPKGLRLRFEASSFLWQYDYPDSYYLEGPDGNAIVVRGAGGSSPWTNNWGLSAGASLPIFR